MSEKRGTVYHTRISDDWEHDTCLSGVVMAENNDNIKKIIEDKWGIAFHDYTSRVTGAPSDSRTYTYLSPYGATARLQLRPYYPFSVIRMDLVSFNKDSIKRSLESLGLEYDEAGVREGNPF